MQNQDRQNINRNKSLHKFCDFNIKQKLNNFTSIIFKKYIEDFEYDGAVHCTSIFFKVILIVN